LHTICTQIFFVPQVRTELPYILWLECPLHKTTR
jgi:hypothetical protein